MRRRTKTCAFSANGYSIPLRVLRGGPERGGRLDRILYFGPSFQGLNSSEGVITCD
jgi:hypothetical protein